MTPPPAPDRARQGLCVAAWLPLAFLASQVAFGQPTYLLRNALLIDGSGQSAKPGTDILIRGGLVAAISPGGSIAEPNGAVVLDATDKAVVPGIINVRGLAGLVRGQNPAPGHFTEAEILGHLRTYASYGVTTTATAGPNAALLASLRDRIVTPLRALVTTRPAAGTWPGLDPIFQVVRSPEEAEQAVDLLSGQGADFVEFRSDSDATASDIAVAEAAVARALHHGLRAAVVAADESLVLAAVRAGARTVAGSLATRDAGAELIRALRETGTVYAPALSAMLARIEYGDSAALLDDRYLRRSLRPGVSGILRGPERIRQSLDPDRALRMHQFDQARRNLGRIERAGVTIALASGSGVPGTFEGFTEYREAVLMKRAGMSALSVIRAFSAGSAEALGIAHGRGALRVGHVADLVVLNENPLENIHALRELHAVFVGGSRASL